MNARSLSTDRRACRASSVNSMCSNELKKIFVPVEDSMAYVPSNESALLKTLREGVEAPMQKSAVSVRVFGGSVE